jgi:2-oxoglutarate ferredoxin oxidoreductase subunit beta
MQINDMGFSFVELLSACPTNWGLNPKKSIERIEKELIPYFPLGVFKERKGTDNL